jgi:hypothetical protein
MPWLLTFVASKVPELENSLKDWGHFLARRFKDLIAAASSIVSATMLTWLPRIRSTPQPAGADRGKEFELAAESGSGDLWSKRQYSQWQ